MKKISRKEEILNNCLGYISNLGNRNEYIDILVNSVGLTKEELYSFGFDSQDIEEYFLQGNKEVL